MHNQRREEYKARLRDDATAKKLATKATQWHILSAELIKRRAELIASIESTETKEGTESTETETAETQKKKLVETLKLNNKVLSVNPDPMYLWNLRRDFLLQCIDIDIDKDLNMDPKQSKQSKQTSLGVDAANEFIAQEQILTQAALQRNPKAYGAWFHRKWSLRKYVDLIFAVSFESASENKMDDEKEKLMSTTTQQKINQLIQQCTDIFKSELILSSEFLKMDERNFHCWNYRRFIVSTLATLISIDTTSLIDDVQSIIIDGSWTFLNSDFDNTSSHDTNDISNAATTGSARKSPVIGPQLTTPTTSTQKHYKSITSSSSSSSPTSIVSNHNIKEVYQILSTEWQFTSEKIYQNFSNGSAFHYRSKLLPIMSYYNNHETLTSTHTMTQFKSRSDWVQEELELIRNAIFTEPDDQTSWWYFRFILAWANPYNHSSEYKYTNNMNINSNFNEGDDKEGDKEEALEEYKQMLYEEWTSIQELVETEGGQCKWGLLGLYMIATTFIELHTSGVDNNNDNDDDNDDNDDDAIIEYEGENWLELALTYLDDLIALDPDRKLRYETMKEKLVQK